MDYLKDGKWIQSVLSGCIILILIGSVHYRDKINNNTVKVEYHEATLKAMNDELIVSRAFNSAILVKLATIESDVAHIREGLATK